MPNGGVHHCGNCRHYQNDAAHCGLRGVPIDLSHWTTCRNFNHPGTEPSGPIYAIVCEVKSRAAAYGDIPYFDGVRVDTVQEANGGDTFVCFTDKSGNHHEFPTVAEYLLFYEKSGRQY
jgi:hypothetical protein